MRLLMFGYIGEIEDHRIEVYLTTSQTFVC